MLWRVALPILALLALPLAGSASTGEATAPAILMARAQARPEHVWTPEAWSAHRAEQALDASQPPVPGIQSGLGPGSAMQQGVGSTGYICTAAFILRDPYTGTYYLSTAGHCLVRDEADPAPYTGADNPDKVDDVIQVCVANCVDNAGLLLGDYVEIRPSNGVHPVTFAQSGGIGLDFGIIQLPPALHGDLRPEMPMWGGPTGLGTSSDSADFVVHYGHGSYCCPEVGAVATRSPADQGRIGLFSSASDTTWEAYGSSSGGDSGSGVSFGVSGGSDGVSGGKALGVLTHGFYVASPAASLPIFTGTMLTKGLAMVKETTGLDLELVLAGDPLPTTPSATPPPVTATNLTVTAPAAGATIDPAVKHVTVKGLAGPSLANGTQVQVAIDDKDYGFNSRLIVQGNSSWSATWDLAGVPNGQHTIRARIVDASGEVLDQDNVTVTLKKGAGTASTSRSGTGSSAASGSADASDDGKDEGGAFGLRDGAKGAPGPGVVPALAALGLLAWSRRRR